MKLKNTYQITNRVNIIKIDTYNYQFVNFKILLRQSRPITF
jgi:hypothetical protein